jgi:hypothetical protein
MAFMHAMHAGHTSKEKVLPRVLKSKARRRRPAANGAPT